MNFNLHSIIGVFNFKSEKLRISKNSKPKNKIRSRKLAFSSFCCISFNLSESNGWRNAVVWMDHLCAQISSIAFSVTRLKLLGLNTNRPHKRSYAWICLNAFQVLFDLIYWIVFLELVWKNRSVNLKEPKTTNQYGSKHFHWQTNNKNGFSTDFSHFVCTQNSTWSWLYFNLKGCFEKCL